METELANLMESGPFLFLFFFPFLTDKHWIRGVEGGYEGWTRQHFRQRFRQLPTITGVLEEVMRAGYDKASDKTAWTPGPDSRLGDLLLEDSHLGDLRYCCSIMPKFAGLTNSTWSHSLRSKKN
jgi:hypothetical protein